jgi:4-hydroxyphenylpyruvate dioxygenase
MLDSSNPCHLDGFSFLEFSSLQPEDLRSKINHLGFTLMASHLHLPIEVWQQGQIFFIINNIPNSQALEHAKVHKIGPCAMGFNVKNCSEALKIALAKGAKAATAHPIYNCPAIEGIGGSVIYFTDGNFEIFNPNEWQIHHEKPNPGAGLEYIDHLTHNVHRGHLKTWSDFYHDIFGFKEIRDFNIQGQHTGLYSQALGSPCGKIKIPLNESKDEHSQIEEFLHDYNGEGIQHIALHTGNIYSTITNIQNTGVKFLDTPDTYFSMIKDRLPWHNEPVDNLQKLKILIDGGPKPQDGILLQIFTENFFGPVFFEIIQRKGHQGFGEGNFQALFEAIERDQILRGKLEQP